MNDGKKPRLRVIDGTGGGNNAIQSGALALALDTTLSEGHQLALPGVIPSCSIISVSPAALYTRNLASVLREFRVRHFVDMRLAVEFWSLGMGRRAFEAVMQRLGLDYLHIHDLANRDHKLYRSSGAKWAGFRGQLQRDSARAALQQLRESVEDGPVALLSESPYHGDSERRIVVEALHGIRPGFAFQYIDPVR